MCRGQAVWRHRGPLGEPACWLSGLGTQGEGGRKGPQMEAEEDPFFPSPVMWQQGLVVGAALSVLVYGLAIQLEDRGSSSDGHTEASLELLEGVQAFFSRC